MRIVTILLPKLFVCGIPFLALSMHLYNYIESDCLHEDVREGRIPKADERRGDGEKEEGSSAPTNGKKNKEFDQYVL